MLLLWVVFSFYALKSNAQKVSTFQKIFGTSKNDYGSAIIELPDKGFLIAGATGETNPLNQNPGEIYKYKILVIRTDSLGRQIWAKTFTQERLNDSVTGYNPVSGTATIAVADMILTSELNVVICSNTLNSTKCILFKINLDGSLIWSKAFAHCGYGVFLLADKNGGYVITGTTSSQNNPRASSTNSAILVIKTDSGGNLIWANSYSPSYSLNDQYYAWGYQIIQSQSGGFLISGTINYTSLNKSQFWSYLIMKIDGGGKLSWSKVYSASDYPKFYSVEEGRSIIEMPDKSIYVFGMDDKTTGIGPNNSEIFTGSVLKLDSNGNLKWYKLYEDLNSNSQYVHFCSAFYDKVKNVFDVSTIIRNYGMGLAQLDTSGKVIFSNVYDPISSSSHNPLRCTGHDFLKLKSGGFAILQSIEQVFASTIGYHIHFIKTDSEGNTNGCSTAGFPLSISLFPIKNLYTVLLSTLNPNTDTGCTVASIKLIDNVICPPFVADFVWLNPCDSQKTFFYDSSYYKATSWQWDFGDPSSSTNSSILKNPVHIYINPGKYKVQLIASNGTVTDTIVKTIQIYPLPMPFSFDTTICQANTIKLKAKGGTTYLWQQPKLVSDAKSAYTFTTPNKTSQYTVAVSNAQGCAIIDTVHVTVDNKPNLTKILYATVISNAEIDVPFQKSDSSDVSYYEIYRSENDSPFRIIANLPSTIFSSANTCLFKDSVVNANLKNYAYKIVCIDSCGAASDTSIVHQPVLLLLKPDGCRPVLDLSWDAYIGWPAKKIELYRSVNGGAFKLYNVYGNSLNNYQVKDTGLDYRNLYCYKVLVFDNNGNYVSQSNAACGKVFFPDTAQVVTATKISTSLTNGTVIIRLKNINKPNFAYNELYYSGDGKNFTLLSKVPSTQDSFVHTGINTQTADQYYYIITVDSCGQTSLKSVIHKTMDLTVSVGQLLHKLNWTPYLGFKVKGYKVERLEKGQFVAIDSVLGTDTFSREFPAPCNFNIRYRIAAVGYNPGELSWSDTMGRIAIDTIPSDSPVITNATVLNGTATRIKFKGSDSLDTYKFAIQRSINGNWNTAGSILFTKPGDSLTYIDNVTNNINNHICYTIIALDSCLNATPSDTVCVINVTVSSLYCTKQALLTWTGCINKSGCPNSYTIYRSTDAVNYVQLAKLNGGITTYSDTSLKLGIKYYYKIEGLNTNTGIGSFSDTISTTPAIIPTAGNAQFVYATVLKTDPKGGQIYIVWRRAALSDTNARGYYVYSYDSTNKKYALLKDVTNLNDTTYTNSNLNTLHSTYKYYIITYNVCDVGNGSNIHKTVLLSVNSTDSTGSSAHSGGSSAKWIGPLATLHWTNYLGEQVKNYSIYKSIDGGKPILLKDAGLDSTDLDTNLYCNHTYTYQIQAILENGKISFSDSVTIKGQDTIKPITNPISLATVISTSTSNGKIQVSWLPANSPSGARGQHGGKIAGYNIFRSKDAINWLQILFTYPGLSLVDSGLNTYRQPYYYRIQAIDSCGNLGSYSPIHKTINLKASSGNQFIQLNWNTYQGWEVKKYLVYKDGNLIATMGKDTTNFKDTLVVCTTTYHYLIKAVCDTTNDTLISFSNTDSIKSFDHKAPQKVYIKTVTVSNPNKAVTITWNPSASFDTKNYLIYRKSGINGDMKFVDSTNQLSYIDSISEISTIRQIRDSDNRDDDCYYIFAQDHCGNVSSASNEGCVIILNAQNQQFYNTLNWNGYQTWYDGVLNYNVYKKEDNQPWNLIGTTTSGIIHNFTDKDLGDSTINFCYQVEAVENLGQYNQLSRSTVACVHQDATVFIPNSFTHFNLDGLNDYFGPKGLYIKNYTMQIYNRWGELVYSTTTGKPWDGTFKGAEALEGVYIYLITIEDYNAKKSSFNGNITIFR